MYEITITEQIKHNAKKKSDEMGVIKGSVRGGSGNMIGFLGEELVKSYLNIGDSNTVCDSRTSSRTTSWTNRYPHFSSSITKVLYN